MRQLVISRQITNRDEESVNRYFCDINKYEMISAEMEVELSERIKRGDDIALERLVIANLRFVVSVAKQYQNQGISFIDLINEGNVGLIKAASKFDSSRGFKFISYAVWWIRQSIMQAIAEQNRIVRLPFNRIASINKVSKAIPFLEQELHREPTDDELAIHLDISKGEIENINLIKKREVSFDKPLNSSEDSDFSLYDTVQTGNIPPPDDNLMRESLGIKIKDALSTLPIREAEVVSKLFGLGGNEACSLGEVSVLFGMSGERVRQIKASGLRKLKSFLIKHELE
jgi:RNA polymerase primary sigma factor